MKCYLPRRNINIPLIPNKFYCCFKFTDLSLVLVMAWHIITKLCQCIIWALRWRHNGCDSVSNHQPHHCLLNRLFRHRSKKTSKLRVTGLCVGNYANPAYGVATICHQVRWVRWGHPSLFHTATSLLIWYKMFCAKDFSYRLIWMEFINMFSVYAQSGTHSRFNRWIVVVLTYNPSVLMCVEITEAPKL